MAITQGLEIRQGQTLVMTPQLQQAIKLLQMSHLELTAHVEAAIEANPVLERADEIPEPAAYTDARGDGPEEAARGREAAAPEGLGAAARAATGGESALDTEVGTFWGDNDAGAEATADGRAAKSGTSVEGGGADGFGMDGVGALAAGGGERGGRRDFDGPATDGVERAEAGPASLRDHLREQINIDIPDPDDRLIASALVEGLDESGYLAADPETLADQLGCAAAEIERVLRDHCQRLDPAGIFARDLRECLALQLAERDRLDPAMAALLDNLDALAAGKLDRLLKICGVGREDLLEMIAELRALDPKPAVRFETAPAVTVVPDILMEPGRDGGWRLELNPDTLPRVLVNSRYVAEIDSGRMSKSDKAWLHEQLAEANWLVKALDQRARTILKVAGELVRQQDDFFAHGVGRLRPLVLRDVAEAIGMHESTVSRVTANKFIATPRGLFELKYFFSPAIPRLDGREAMAAEAVRARIREMIEAEPAGQVLSDDALVSALRCEGIDVARRTVAKYRESLGLASSVQRRRDKAVAAWQ